MDMDQLYVEESFPHIFEWRRDVFRSVEGRKSHFFPKKTSFLLKMTTTKITSFLKKCAISWFLQIEKRLYVTRKCVKRILRHKVDPCPSWFDVIWSDFGRSLKNLKKKVKTDVIPWLWAGGFLQLSMKKWIFLPPNLPWNVSYTTQTCLSVLQKVWRYF